MTKEKTPTSIDKYQLARCRQLGLFGVYAYRCKKCLYVWLPKDVEILKVDALVDRPLPKSCARCKSKSWNNATRRSVSVARIRTLLRNGKRDTVVYLLSGIGQRKKDKIIDALATNLERQQEVLELDHDIELGRIVRHRWSGDIP